MNFAFLSSVLAALIGLALILLSPFSTWDSLDIVGPMLVLIGIAREFWLLLNKLPKDAPPDAESKKHNQEIAAALVVILGVAVELIVVPHSLVETADLKLRTAEVEVTNAAIWQTNIVLRSNLVALELKLQPRIITPEQVTNFIFLTGKIKKIPLTVSVGQEGFDTETFAYQLRQMFSQAGFGTNDGSGSWGIKRDTTRLLATITGSQVTGCDICLITPSLESKTNILAKSFLFETANGKPVIDSTNEEDVYRGVCFVLERIGFRVNIREFGGWNGPPAMEFFVHIKGQL